MSMAELFICLLVALIAFGPKQLPMVARHLGRAVRFLTQLKVQAIQYWHTQAKEWQLMDDEEKAAQADKMYHQSSGDSGNRSTKE